MLLLMVLVTAAAAAWATYTTPLAVVGGLLLTAAVVTNVRIWAFKVTARPQTEDDIRVTPIEGTFRLSFFTFILSAVFIVVGVVWRLVG